MSLSITLGTVTNLVFKKKMQKLISFMGMQPAAAAAADDDGSDHWHPL